MRAIVSAFERVPEAQVVVGYYVPGTEFEGDVVLLWRRGVFVIETKGWGPTRFAELCRRGADQFQIGGDDNPIHQAYKRAYDLKETIRRATGEPVRVEVRAALPNMDVDVLTQDQRMALLWETREERRVLDDEDLGVKGDTQQLLTSRQVVPLHVVEAAADAVRGVVHHRQDFVCVTSPQAFAMLSGKQRELVEWPPARLGNHRSLLTVKGCAGSGKTLIAVHRAWRAVERGRTVLIACCNRSLEAKLREVVTRYADDRRRRPDVALAPVAILRTRGLADDARGFDPDQVLDQVARTLEDDVDYREYAQLARQRGDDVSAAVVARELMGIWAMGFSAQREYLDWSGRPGRFLDPKGDELHELCWDMADRLRDESQEARALRECARTATDPPKRLYDEVIVDEAQDAYPVWLEGLAQSVTPEGRMVVLFDRSQSVHRIAMPVDRWAKDTRSFASTSKDPRQLDTDYRFPEDVFHWCRRMKDHDEVFAVEVDELDGEWRGPVHCDVPGHALHTERARSEEAALDRAEALAQQALYDEGYSCAVFYLGGGQWYGGRRDDIEDRWRRLQTDHPGLEVAPLGGLRGLEFDRVILLGFNEDFPHPELDAESASQVRRMFLVAVTRTRVRLDVLYWTERPSPFVSELAQAGVAPPDQA